jgi:hypothetical protein
MLILQPTCEICSAWLNKFLKMRPKRLKNAASKFINMITNTPMYPTLTVIDVCTNYSLTAYQSIEGNICVSSYTNGGVNNVVSTSTLLPKLL